MGRLGSNLRTTPLVEAASGYPPGRSGPQQTSAELVCGLVNGSDELQRRLRRQGIDPDRLKWPPLTGTSRRRLFAESKEIQRVLTAAAKAAFDEGHEWIGAQHVLRAIADLPDSSGARWLAAEGIDAGALRALTDGWIDAPGADERWPLPPPPPIGASASWSAELGGALDWGEQDFAAKHSSSELLDGLLHTSARLREELARYGAVVGDGADASLRGASHDLGDVLAAAGHLALTAGENEVRLSHVLRALAAQPESDAARWLANHGLRVPQLDGLADRWDATEA